MSDANKPLYIRIADSVKEQIDNKVYDTGDLLPTEEELEKLFNASRTSIRSAIGVLENEGLVIRKQGKGTIVKAARTAQKLNSISSLTEAFEQKGVSLKTINLSIERIDPPPKIMKAFGVSEVEPVYLVQRTRVIANEPIAFVNNYLLARKVPRLEDRLQKLYNIGLYRLLEEEYGLKLHHAVESISVYISGPLESEILHVQERTPLFYSIRTTFLDDGTAFEYVTSFIKYDKYEYTVYLEGRSKSM